MTILDQDVALPPAPPGGGERAPVTAPPSPPDVDADVGDEVAVGAPVHVPTVALSAALAAGSAAWIFGGLIRTAVVPRLLALLGVGIGAGLVWWSYRQRRPATLQFAVIPVAMLVGAVLLAPLAQGGTANLPNLVAEAVGGGGLLQPPIPFDPGWRFILVVFFALLAAAAIQAAVMFERPKLAVLVPAPITLVAALFQPKGDELVASIVAVCLIVAALSVNVGAEVATASGTVSARFELGRLRRAGVLMIVLSVLMVGLSRADFLFPEPDKDDVIPPQRPQVGPVEEDRKLFLARSTHKGPWRVGVLDTYDGRGWLLPALDPTKEVPLGDDPVPGAPSAKAGVTQTIELRILDMKGRSLPVPGQLVSLTDAKRDVIYDTVTGVPRLEERVPAGFRYTVTALKPPSTKDLTAARKAVDADILSRFSSAPAVPGAVARLLTTAPKNPYDRLQFLRVQLFANVVAAGAGQPGDVPPARVSAMLRNGTEASPFEITAAEALLARWAGLPSRIGFGYSGGTRTRDGFELHPRDGSAWLEVYFQDLGWVPLVGTPKQAKSSLSTSQKNRNTAVKATDELAITIYVPTRARSVVLFYHWVRYWLSIALPFVLAGILLFLAYPVLMKRLRSRRRRRWAGKHGPVARAGVAYAEFRDRLLDHNLGDRALTPLEFRRGFEPDEEHDELAWLLTRLVWGDLARDERPAFSVAVQQMSDSLLKRILSEQSPMSKISGRVSKTSLRTPYTDEVPNLWPQLHVRRRLRRVVRGVGRVLDPRRLLGRLRRPSLRPGTAVVLLAVLISGCGGAKTTAGRTVVPPVLPSDATLLSYRFTPLPEGDKAYRGPESLATEGKVWAIRQGDVIQGTMQIAVMGKQTNVRDADVRRQIQQSLPGRFVPFRIGTSVTYEQLRADQSIYLWYPPGYNAWVIFVFRSKFADSRRLLRAAILSTRGDPLSRLVGAPDLPPPAPEVSPSAAGTPTPSSTASGPSSSPSPEEPS